MKNDTKLLFILILPIFAFAQFGVISGTVADEKGSPLAGANVQVVGTNLGTATGLDGRFELAVPGTGPFTVRVSYIGFEAVEQSVSAGEDVNFALSSDVLQLSEIVVTGRGSATREQLGISIEKVGGAELVSSGEANMITSLAAKATGVEVTGSSGEPGSGAYIRIRGANTVLFGQQPLIVVDGSPIDNSTYGNSLGYYGPGQGATTTNRAYDINPADIADIQILKGAAAASLYGTKAKNGVILIRTKSGVAGQRKINYRFSQSFDEVAQQPKLNKRFGQGYYGKPKGGPGRQTSLSWGPLLADLSATDSVGGLPVFADDPYAYQRNGEIYDHDKDIYTTGNKIAQNISVSGGGDRTTYFLSFGNTQHNGFFIGENSFNNRNTARVKATYLASDNLSVTGNLAYSKVEHSGVQMGSNLSGLLLGNYRTPPNFDNNTWQDPNTGYHRSYRLQRPTSITGGRGYDNPFFTLNEQRNLSDVDRVFGNIETGYKLGGGVDFLYRYGVDYSSDFRRIVLPQGTGEFPDGMVDVHKLRTGVTDHVFQLSVNRKLGGIALNGTLGQNINREKYERTYVLGEKMSVFDFRQLDNTIDYTPDETQREIITASTYANATFGLLDGALFLTGGFNYDGSSTFGVKNRFATFPRASATLKFSELVSLPGIDNGLVRFAWGQAGSTPSPYSTINTFYSGDVGDGWGPTLNHTYNGYGGFVTSSTLANPDIKPEVTTETEIGLDLALFNNRIRLEFTQYKQLTEDLILRLPLAPSTGYYSMLANAGSMKNEGIELGVGARLLDLSFLAFDVDFKYAANKNEVTDLAVTDSIDYIGIGGFSSAAAVAMEGEQFGVFRGGDWLYDANGDFIVDDNGFPQEDEEVRIIGDPNPDALGSLRLSAHVFNKISVSALFDFRIGGDIWNGTRGALSYFGAHGNTDVITTVSITGTDDDGNPVTGYVDYRGRDVGSSPYNWHKDNGDGTVSFRGYLKDFGAGEVAVTDIAYFSGPFSGFTGPAAQFVEDGGYTKLRELSIVYNYDGALIKGFGLNSVDVGLSFRNLFTWTDYSGVDPETNLSGTGSLRGYDYFNMPQTRSTILTLSVNL